MKKAELIKKLETIKTHFNTLRAEEDHKAWVNEGSSSAGYHIGKRAAYGYSAEVIENLINEIKS